MSDAELMRRLLDLTEEDEFEVAIVEKDDTATKH
jgi:hypothetical protein